MALIGNTVLLSSEPPQEAGDLNLLTNVRVKIYTTELKLLQDLGVPTKISDGKYEIRYTVTGNLFPEPLN